MQSWRGIVFCLFSLTALGGAESVTVEGVLIDNWCALTTKSDAMAREHARACALMDGCVNSGFAIYASGKVIKFERAGNEQALRLLESSAKARDVQVIATGTLEGNLLTLAAIREK